MGLIKNLLEILDKSKVENYQIEIDSKYTEIRVYIAGEFFGTCIGREDSPQDAYYVQKELQDFLVEQGAVGGKE